MEIADSTRPDRQASVESCVDALVRELEPLQRQYNELLWTASVTGDPAAVEASARLDVQVRGIFARPEPNALLQGARAAGPLPDASLDRQLILFSNTFRAHQIRPEMIERIVRLEKSLENRFNHFRAQLDGVRVSDNQLRQVLRHSADSGERRRAWEASKQVGSEVRDELLALVRLRNEAAREVGFDNYYTMMLTLDELDETELVAMLEALERGTRPAFERYKGALDAGLSKRFGVPAGELCPWHYSDPFFQEAPASEIDLDPFFQDRPLVEMAREFFSAIGFDIDDLLTRADLYEKPGKSQHAFCMSVDRGADIRVLCNLKPNEFWMGTLLHECGHAIYDQAIDRTLPFALRTPAHTLTTEASAMLFGRLSKNAAWLERYAGVPESVARPAGARIGRAIRGQLLVQTRWCMVMCAMERALYRDPEQDLDALWWDLVEHYQGLSRPAGRRAPDWASKIHFSVAPVYYHNYLLGEMMASQLQSFVLDRVVPARPNGPRDEWVSSPELGRFLTDRLYRYGKSVDWREAIRTATGRALAPEDFVEELSREDA